MRIRVQTPSAEIEFIVRCICVETTEILRFFDMPHFESLCKEGCSNYGKKWSCPPFAPEFSEFTSSYKYLYIFVLHTEMNQFSYIKNDYLKVKAANSILKSRMDKTLRILSLTQGGYISTGSCRMCKPCKCKLNMPCAHREKMSYSFEALGIDVGNMTECFLGHTLLWYKKGNLPSYTSVVGGLLMNQEADAQNLEKCFCT